MFFRLFFLFSLLSFSCFVHGVELRQHQKYATNFLFKRPQQQGLLIYHGLGTGKTYLSLGFAELYQDKKIIVIMPRFLKSNWEIQIKSFGVKDRSRFKFLSLREAPELLDQYDFKNTIVVIDEVHKLIDRMKSANIKSAKYAKLYFSLQNSFKILALTGTPIFSSAIDLSYIANLIQNKNPMTFNPVDFYSNYMDIKPVTSLFRGYFTESKLVISTVPLAFTFGFVPWVAALNLGQVGALLMGGAFMTPFMINEQFPADKVSFRSFNVNKLKDFAKNYISFYEVPLKDSHLYPRKIIHREKIPYTEAQTKMFLEFADESMNTSALKAVLSEQEQIVSDEYIELNSFTLQKSLLLDPSSGREIGNFPIYDPLEKKALERGDYYPYRADNPQLKYKNTKFVEPHKFEEVYKILQKKPGKAAIYSNYFTNGILQFAQFLERKGKGDDFVILNPENPVKDQIKAIELYNTGKKKIILLHPEVTEGVSLVETEQLHILEPISNAALLDQVIGRAVRFESHKNLPKERQKVDVHLWQSYVSYCNFSLLGVCFFPTDAGLLRRKHWQRRYPEMNPSTWTYGITFLDKNYSKKSESPDLAVERNSYAISNDMNNFKKFAKEFSIEKNKTKKNES